MSTPEPNGTLAWRMSQNETAVRDERRERRDAIQRLDVEKANDKDVVRLTEEFVSLRRTLQWFMGLVAAAVVAFAGIVVQLVGS